MNFLSTAHTNLAKTGLLFCLAIFCLSAYSIGDNNKAFLGQPMNTDNPELPQNIDSAKSSQVKHLTVLGIPITGSISSFQNRLLNKKYHIDSRKNKELPIGQREFKGIYSGHQCSLRAYYFPDDI